MNRWFGVAGLLTLGASLLHALAGERLILAPLRAKGSPKESHALIWEAAWHLITWHLVCLAASLAALAVWRNQAWAAATLAQLAGYGALFFVMGRPFGQRRLERASPVGLPQAPLFFTIAAFCAGGMLSRSSGLLNSRTTPMALVVAATLALLAGLHVMWAVGSAWPARDRKSLGLLVVGAPLLGGMPSKLATWLVALALALGAGLVLLGAGVIHPRATAGGLATLAGRAGWGMVVVFAVRGIGGFFERVLRPTIRGTPYAHWNERLYSPLCLSLAILLASALPP